MAVTKIDLARQATAYGDVNVNSNKITNVSTPTAAGDAANKSYVDNYVQGLDVHASVRVVTNAALPSYSRTGNVITASANGALAAIDGVTLVLNDRLLLKNGAAGADNGIYYVSVVGDGSTPFELTRATDADSSAEVTAGMFMFVEEGTVYADTGWVLITDNPITLNTTSLSFSQFNGAAGITAGAGLTKTGNTIDVVSGNGAIVVNADDITFTVDATAANLQVVSGGARIARSSSANQLLIGQGSGTDTAYFSVSGDLTMSSAGNFQIAADAVGTAEIAADAVTSSEIASDAVKGSELDQRKESRTGSTSATWQLAATPFDDDHLLVYLNGQLLIETADYTRSTDTITFLNTPINTLDVVAAVYFI